MAVGQSANVSLTTLKWRNVMFYYVNFMTHGLKVSEVRDGGLRADKQKVLS